MNIGVIVVWLSLIIYLVIMVKTKVIEKKERKWLYLLVMITIGFSLLFTLTIYLNGVTTYLNNFFGRLSRMVVKT